MSQPRLLIFNRGLSTAWINFPVISLAILRNDPRNDIATKAFVIGDVAEYNDSQS